jgi:hypothetical protein
MITSVVVGSGQPLPEPVGCADHSIVVSRLRAMGLWFSETMPIEPESLSVSDLFPWWMIKVIQRDRCQVSHGHLGSLLTRHRYGLRDDSYSPRPFQTLCAGIPLGSAEIQGQSIHACLMSVVNEGGLRRENDVTALLCALAHLERAGSGQPIRFASAAKSLVDEMDSFQVAHRAIAHLVALHGFESLIDTVGRMLQFEHRATCLEAAGSLLQFGGAGRERVEAAHHRASPRNRAVIDSVLESAESGTLDALDPWLNDDDWQVRASAARVIAHLMASRCVNPGFAMEALIARMENESENDNRWVLSQTLGQAVAADPDQAVDMIFSKLGDLEGTNPTRDLMCALSLGVGPAVDAGIFERLRDGFSEFDESSRCALNRCLSWVDGMPVSPFDWICPEVIRSLQWGRWALPASVASWFSSESRIESHLVTATLYRERMPAHLASLGLHHLNRNPHVLPIWEQVLTRAANLGNDAVWEVFAAIIAGSRISSGLMPVELRCAIGAGGTPCPEFSPAGIGRLIALASTSLRSSKEAVELLSQASPDIREIARNALMTVADGIQCPADLQSLPPRCGLGPSRCDPSPLGLWLNRSARPEEMSPEYQPLFGMGPAGWKKSGSPLEGLLVSCQHRTRWGDDVFEWFDPQEVAALLQREPASRVQQAVAACCLSGVETLVEVGQILAASIEGTPPDGPLGEMVAICQERHEQRLADAPLVGGTVGERGRNLSTYLPGHNEIEMDEID